MSTTVRCEFCTAEAVAETAPFCLACAAKYEVGNCAECGTRWVVSRALDWTSDLCWRCASRHRLHGLDADLRASLDDLILANDIVGGQVLLVERLLVSFSESKDLFATRYGDLRNECPERFTCSHEAYWGGYYS